MNTCTGAREHVVTLRKNGREGADYWPRGVYPSCLHTTWASRLSQRSSHTVPHTPPTHTSTLPSLAVLPSSRRRSPVLQALSRSRTVGTAMAGEIRTQISHASRSEPRYTPRALPHVNNRKRVGLVTAVASQEVGRWEHIPIEFGARAALNTV